MSFAELFKDLSQFVKDPDVRWEYCLRAKRGQTDTSVPGRASITDFTGCGILQGCIVCPTWQMDQTIIQTASERKLAACAGFHSIIIVM